MPGSAQRLRMAANSSCEISVTVSGSSLSRTGIWDWRGREGVREGEREMIKKSIRVLVDKAP